MPSASRRIIDTIGCYGHALQSSEPPSHSDAAAFPAPPCLPDRAQPHRPSANGARRMIIGKGATGPFTRGERILITVPVLIASILHSLALTTAYIALPNMKGNLSATPDQAGWIITSFLVSNAIGVAATGWFSVRFGRKRVFLVAIAGFTLSSMLCATATTLDQIVLYRILQGTLSAPILPLSQAIMLDTYPRERHSFAMTTWSLAMILGPVLGPSLGAVLTEEFSWRAISTFRSARSA
jgi:DHA2 family multidrug resistance protein